MTEFVQWTSTTRTYLVDHLDLDGGHLPIISKPEWSVEHSPADSNVRQVLATLELSTDATSARLTTGNQPGQMKITVSAHASPTAFASRVFIVNVKRHEPVTSRAPTLTVTQGRNISIHH